ncbi:HORMA domain-containing protein [Obelidium mucronatum]|nr:HORMA domain-containing protein [Obelidium mucronatum]
MITVLFFAAARELVQTDCATIDLSPNDSALSVADALRTLTERFPPLEKILDSCLFAVNMDYVDRNEGLLASGDELAIIPPPSMQVQKPRTVVATPTHTESLQLVQNLLRSSFAAISYLRGLFPEDSFEDVCLNGMKLKKLKRGASDDVNSLNEWLEKGCFEALEKKYLKSIVFGVYTDPATSSAATSTLIESYMFTFTYPQDGRFEMVVDSTIDEFKKEIFKLKSKKESVNAMMSMLRRILVMTQALQPINDTPKVSMKIFYYENVTPHDYEPPSFRKGEPSEYDSDEVKMEQFELGRVDVNHHAVCLQVRTTMGLVDSEEEEADDQAGNDSHQNAGHDTNESMEVSDSQEAIVDEEILAPCSQATSCSSDEKLQVYAEPSTNGTMGYPLSQISNLTNILAVLQTENPSSDKSPHALDAKTINEGPRSVNRISTTPEVNIDMDDYAPSVVFQSPADEEVSVRRSTRHRGRRGENSQISVVEVVDNPESLNCPCGSQIIELPMLACIYCHKLNHPQCSGYYSEVDPRIPPAGHCCYSCANIVFHPNAYNLEEAANVAIIRRGLAIASSDLGVVSVGAFATRMGVSLGVAKLVIKTLEDEDFLKPVKRIKNQQHPGLLFSFAVAKRRSTRFSYWMSGFSLLMAPDSHSIATAPTGKQSEPEDIEGDDETIRPDAQSQAGDDESEVEESQEVLGKPISFYSRTPKSERQLSGVSSAEMLATLKREHEKQEFDDCWHTTKGHFQGSLDSQGFSKSVAMTQEFLVNQDSGSTISHLNGRGSKRGNDDDDDMTQDTQSSSRGSRRAAGSEKRVKMSIAMRSQEF